MCVGEGVIYSVCMGVCRCIDVKTALELFKETEATIINECKLHGFYLGSLVYATEDMRAYIMPKYSGMVKPDCKACGWECSK